MLRYSLILLAACGQPANDAPLPATLYPVAVAVTGLAGTGLTLSNGNESLAIASNGLHAFETQIEAGAAYAITLVQQPAHLAQTCTLDGGTGTQTADPVPIAVTCVTKSFQVQGEVRGPSGAMTFSLGTETTALKAGAFAFTVLDGTKALFAITKQPVDASCVVPRPDVQVDGADVTVQIACASNVLPRDAVGDVWARAWVNKQGTQCLTTEVGHLACLPAGPRRRVELYGVPSCDGVSASDDLQAFDWYCQSAGDHVRLVSNHLALPFSNLIDFDALAYKANRVQVSIGGVPVATATGVWWKDAVSASYSTLPVLGVHAVTGNTAATGLVYPYGVLVVKPGAKLKTPGVAMGGLDWFEGALDGSDEPALVGSAISSEAHTVVDHVTVSGYAKRGLNSGAHNLFVSHYQENNSAPGADVRVGLGGQDWIVEDVRIANAPSGSVQLATENGVLTGLSAVSGGRDGFISSAAGSVMFGLTARNNGAAGVSGFLAGTLMGVDTSGNSKGFALSSASYGGGHYFNARTEDNISIHVLSATIGAFVSPLLDIDNSVTLLGPVRSADCGTLNPQCLTDVRVPLGIDVPNLTFTHTWWIGSVAPADIAAYCATLGGQLTAGNECVSEALAFAAEIAWDEVGNDNGLCESHERCLVYRDASAIQGTATTPTPLGVFTAGGLVDLTLLAP